MTLSSGTLYQKLEEFRQFGEEKFPPLVPLVKRNLKDIRELYRQAGHPDGQSPVYEDHTKIAVAWFEQRFITWEKEQELATEDITESVEQALVEMEQLGDLVRTSDGMVHITPKGIARSVRLQTALIVNDADEEQRGLTADEKVTLRHALSLALVQLGEKW